LTLDAVTSSWEASALQREIVELTGEKRLCLQHLVACCEDRSYGPAIVDELREIGRKSDSNESHMPCRIHPAEAAASENPFITLTNILETGLLDRGELSQLTGR
jgi:hypothetical protein